MIRRTEYDVSNSVNMTDSAAVEAEVRRIFRELYAASPTALLRRAFSDTQRLYNGEDPGYHACDTPYHDMQHVLDITLAMARLMAGYERQEVRPEPVGPQLFVLGIVAALLHDVGYLRRRGDTRHRTGAEYTLRHVSRGARFAARYLLEVGAPQFSQVIGSLIHFTGYEIPIARILVPSLQFRRLGNMLGTADILAQMSDRCYLEKCRDRLYPEFVQAGLAGSDALPGQGAPFPFLSPEDLLSKTPRFYQTAMARLELDLGAAYRYLEQDGRNVYLSEVKNNIRHAERIAASHDLSLLKRNPPPMTAAAAKSLTVQVRPRNTGQVQAASTAETVPAL